jgi:hypothetical protein
MDLLALVPSHTFVSGTATEYVDVFATAGACENARAPMQAFTDQPPSDHTIWVCRREQPK